ncbi:hypothetical protein KC19_3G223300 [Ceratodon purpureus]|uniref:Uncharacterized protein n=1 Tax=Ceratodon purpureus TaxID=3225 RepID=A0A8T0IP76_CERPU|nr:hypothetical protein KC19_3G223300 [Ceratodon purpureus]
MERMQNRKRVCGLEFVGYNLNRVWGHLLGFKLPGASFYHTFARAVRFTDGYGERDGGRYAFGAGMGTKGCAIGVLMMRCKRERARCGDQRLLTADVHCNEEPLALRPWLGLWKSTPPQLEERRLN